MSGLEGRGRGAIDFSGSVTGGRVGECLRRSRLVLDRFSDG